MREVTEREKGEGGRKDREERKKESLRAERGKGREERENRREVRHVDKGLNCEESEVTREEEAASADPLRWREREREVLSQARAGRSQAASERVSQ